MHNDVQSYAKFSFLALFFMDFLIFLFIYLSFAGALLQLFSSSPSLLLKLSFAFTEPPSPQRWHGEPSIELRRTLADSMTSLRATS